MKLRLLPLVLLALVLVPLRQDARAQVYDPPPPSVVGDTTSVQLTREGDHFAINGQPEFLLFASYFDALHMSDESAWDVDLEMLKVRNIKGVRVFVNWFERYCVPSNLLASDTLIQPDGLLHQGMLAKVRRFLDLAVQKGMIVNLTFTRDQIIGGISFENYRDGLGRAATALANYRNVVFDVQNEYTNGPRLTDQEAGDAIDAVHAAHSARVASASVNGTAAVDAGSIARTQQFDFVAFHDERGSDWYTDGVASTLLSGIRSGLSPSVMPIFFDEPRPFTAFPGCTNSDQDTDPAHPPEAAKHAKKHGAAAWTFHTRSGYQLAGTSLSAMVSSTELGVIGSVHQPNQCWGANVLSTASRVIADVAAAGASLSVPVRQNGACAANSSWTVTSDSAWLTVTGGSGTGEGSFTVNVAANATGVARTGTVRIPGHASADVTITQAPSTFTAPTLVSPSGAITTPRPTYVWNVVPTATHYELWVEHKGSTILINKWYEAALCTSGECVCDANTCSATPSMSLPALVLDEGIGKWSVRAWRPASQYTAWRSPYPTYSVLSATPISPKATIVPNLTNPTYTFKTVAGATYYKLFVTDATGNILDQWYANSTINCYPPATQCSVTPNLNVAAGTVYWWMRPWINNADGAWSTGVTYRKAPAKPTLISPSGTISSSTTTTFTWNSVPHVTHYYLWVTDSGGNIRHQRWYTGTEAGCASGGTCTMTVTNLTLNPGTTWWWIQAWSEAATFSVWSDGMTFTRQ